MPDQHRISSDIAIGFFAKREAEKMLETPSEILVRLTADKSGQASATGKLYRVTGDYPGEPRRWNEGVGKLPPVVIPVVAEYRKNRPALDRMTEIAASTLAHRIYSLTRSGLAASDLEVKEIEPEETDIWYAAHCIASGVTFYVQRPYESLSDAKLYIESIYRHESPNGFFAGIGASSQAARIWLP